MVTSVHDVLIDRHKKTGCHWQPVYFLTQRYGRIEG
jgi:hypothetical protein